MKEKSFLVTILIMALLFFLWWFSGGTIVGLIYKPSPVDNFSAFIWENFQAGSAIIFEALNSFFR